MKIFVDNFFSKMRNYFLTGLLVVVPFIATILFIKIIIQIYHNIFKPAIFLFAPFQIPVPNFLIPLIGTVIGVLLIIFIGMFTKNIIGKRIVSTGERFLQNVPFIRTIYKLVKQLIEYTLYSQKQLLKGVVLIEWPKKGVYVIGFITSESNMKFLGLEDKKMINVFIPTPPNPASGFFVMVSEDVVTRLDMSIEDALKLIVSLGIVSGDDSLQHLASKQGDRR
ncbi:MAG: DUF502 domain-containing protein [Candidatus Hydrogenedentota bacterium]